MPPGGPVLYCLALGTCVGGFSNVGVVAFRKEMDFRKEFLYATAGKLVAVCTTIPLAFILGNYWALVSGTLVSTVAGVGLSYWVHPFRPRFAITHFRELFNFSKWLFLNNALLFLNSRSTDFIIGKISGAPALGVYSLAWEISTLPTAELAAPINRAVYPGYTKLAVNIPALSAEYLKVLATIILFVLPAAAGIAATAELIVQVVLGAKWAETTPLIRVLAFYGSLMAVATNNGMIFVALGHTRLIALLHGCSVALLVPSLIVATWAFGPVGTAWTFLGLAVLLIPVNFKFVAAKLHLGIGDYAKILWRPVGATAVMWIATHWLTAHWLDQAIGVKGIFILLGVVLSGALIYASSVLLLWLLAGKPGGPEHFFLTQLSTRLKLRK